jgi:mxaL protein
VPGAVRGWILGAGGVEARPIPKTDADGRRRGFWRPEDVVQPEGDGPRREHLSSLREPHLRRLAGRVGFDYARLTPATLAAAMTDPRFARQRPVPTDVRWVPAGLALALLVAVFRPARHRPRPTLNAPSAAAGAPPASRSRPA